MLALLEQLWSVPPLPGTFDPYSDVCPRHDLANAPHIRRENLTRYLVAAHRSRPAYLWVAEAAGYRGSRRTGVPLVPEPMLEPASRRLGIEPSLDKATTTIAPPVRTANAVWAQITDMDRPPLLWNAVLRHPHQAGDPFTNRAPTASERRAFEPVMRRVLEVFRPHSVVAIGRVAESMLDGLDIDVIYVRHPSMGGLARFRQQMQDLSDSSPCLHLGTPGTAADSE